MKSTRTTFRTLDEAMASCIKHAQASVHAGGLPYAAMVLDSDNALISAATNSVVGTCDPTAHAEVNAIRQACRTLSTHTLPLNSTILTTCQPCRLCAAAIHLAAAHRIGYAAVPKRLTDSNLTRDKWFDADEYLQTRSVVVLPLLLAEQGAKLLSSYYRENS